QHSAAGAWFAPRRDRRRRPSRDLRLSDRQALGGSRSSTHGPGRAGRYRAARRDDGVACHMKITVCGIAELGLHCEAGVTHVLSILDPFWPDPEAFTDFPPHHREALRFHDVITPGAEIVMPAEEHVRRLLAFGDDVLVAGDAAHL